MKQISLNKYGPIISDKELGEEIYKLISGELLKSEKVEIDLLEIKSMATFCAKQIFGNLYLSLGSSNFFDRVYLKNASNDLKMIIKIGIQNALDNPSISEE